MKINNDINRFKQMCILGVKLQFSLGKSKKEASLFLKESFLRQIIKDQNEDWFNSLSEETINMIYTDCNMYLIQAEFDSLIAFMDFYKNSDGKDIDDRGFDEADRAALSAITILSKINK